MLRSGNLERVVKDFPELNDASVAQLKEIMNGNAVGKKILHVWYEEGKLITYNGKLEKLKRPHTYKVSYWGLNQPEDDAADYNLSMFELAADLLYKDLLLCE